MLYRFALLILLLLPTTSWATVTATTGFDGGACTGNQTNEGEFTASASFACPGVSASAFANVSEGPFFTFDVQVFGTKVTGLPPVTATASFDQLVLVTGTDQPGFLLLFPTSGFTFSIASPSRIQWSRGSVMGIDVNPDFPG